MANAPSDTGSKGVHMGDRSSWWRLRPVVVEFGPPVVGGALEPTVELMGEATGAEGDDVIDVALFSGHIAPGWVLAVAVAHFDGPSECADETSAMRYRDDGAGAIEQHRLEVGSSEPRRQILGCHDGAVGQLTELAEAVVAQLDTEHRARAAGLG